jgi:uncharacterized protein GlcG (DUF336 family)
MNNVEQQEARPRAAGVIRRAFESDASMKTEAKWLLRALCVVAALAAGAVRSQDATYTVKLMTPETALKAAQAALKKCRDDGFQVTVAVVDRSGVTQAVLRDRFAGPHTVRMAVDKAWTAVSFRTSTAELAKMTQPGSAQSGIRNRPRVTAVAGGLMIESGGSLVGGIGVSGAPGGDRDDICAKAGIDAIREGLEF